MPGKFLLPNSESDSTGNVYADKSALILDWLLHIGINKDEFSIRELANDVKVSLGLVQKVIRSLVLQGLVKTQGIRTSKKFSFKKSKSLLESWIGNYKINKKCKMWTYQTAIADRDTLIKSLNKKKLRNKVAFALHSAAEALSCKNTNLNTLELYLIDPSVRLDLEEVLQLEPQERGYEVLLIQPYYKSLLKREINGISAKNLPSSPPLLTFLDLYHFPLRGQEQAEFILEHVESMKQIAKEKRKR